jgi:hypothetical protein
MASCVTHSAPNGLYRARKLHQEAVTSRLEESPMMLREFGFDSLVTEPFDTGECPFLVLAHECREAHHVGREDRCETADGHSGNPAEMRPSRIRSINGDEGGAASMVFETVMPG